MVTDNPEELTLCILPLHNLKPGTLPATMITTADHDDSSPVSSLQLLCKSSLGSTSAIELNEGSRRWEAYY